MRRFLTQGVLFLILPAALTVLLVLVRAWRHEPLLLDPGVHTVLVGDSQVRFAVDDRELPGVRNLARTSETYFFSYLKLREVLEHNPQVTDVLVGFNYHNLSPYCDDYIFGRPALTIAPRYYDVLDLHAAARLSSSNPRLVGVLLQEALLGDPSAHRYAGRFPTEFPTERCFSPAVMRKRIALQFGGGVEPGDLSALNPGYLRRIERLCARRGVRLTLIATPLHERYRNRVPAAFVAAHRRVAAELGAPVFRFEGLSLGDEDFLPDGDHVSKRGAAAATRYFAARWRPSPGTTLASE